MLEAVATEISPISPAFVASMLLGSGVISAIISGLFTAAKDRRDMKRGERGEERADEDLEIRREDTELRHALSLAAETRSTMTAILLEMREQAEVQARTIVGLNATITTLNETIVRLDSANLDLAGALETQRMLVEERTAERDHLQRLHEESLARIAEQESRLAEQAREMEALAAKVSKE